jgi:NADH:ubiquinone reductase (non-electrogenic)
MTLPYDYLVYAVGAETQTFNIPGVKENACFMKEIKDAEKVGRFWHSVYLEGC